MYNDRNKEWEGIAFVSFENVQEIIILEKAHSSISHLKMQTRNAFNKPFENFGNIRLKFLHLTCFQNLD